MLPMRDDDEQVKIELLSQWKLEAESRNKQHLRILQTGDDDDDLTL